ncbi:hypothetical protein TWF696_004255 [Orbilia brochopaga]|uniref:Uncharacterized protein n=1 Tax=Orbilia brochopaga TaxID=3140254 RepID=A0AAV9V5J9_9PEZI
MKQSFLSNASSKSSTLDNNDDYDDDSDELSCSMTNLSFSGMCDCDDLSLQDDLEIVECQTDPKKALDTGPAVGDIRQPMSPKSPLSTSFIAGRGAGLSAEKPSSDKSIGLDPASMVTTPTSLEADSTALDVKKCDLKLRHHGSDGPSSSDMSSGSGSDGGSDAPSYPPQVRPPHDWGISRQRRRGRSGDDPNEEDNYRRPERGSSRPKPSRTKKYACPAAKGDPFNNPECLGVSFPNLAKTRQHLACNLHFAVNSTTKLPDEVRDPNGWDEIQRYAYPNQEVPSSDEDYYKTLDVIERAGTGPGQPDFRSHIIRMIRRSMDDPEAGRQILSALESIGLESPNPRPDDWYMVTAHVPSSSPSDPGHFPAPYDTADDFESLYDNFQYTIPSSLGGHPGHSPEVTRAPWSASEHVNVVVTSSPGFFDHGLNITSSPRDATSHPFSDFIHAGNMMEDAPPLARADHRHPIDDGLRLGPPAHSHSHDRRPRVVVQLQGTHRGQFSYYPADGAVDFESWVQTMVLRGFSFSHFRVHCINAGGPIDVESNDQLWDIYGAVYRRQPGINVNLVIGPRAGSSRQSRT